MAERPHWPISRCSRKALCLGQAARWPAHDLCTIGGPLSRYVGEVAGTKSFYPRVGHIGRPTAIVKSRSSFRPSEPRWSPGSFRSGKYEAAAIAGLPREDLAMLKRCLRCVYDNMKSRHVARVERSETGRAGPLERRLLIPDFADAQSHLRISRRWCPARRPRTPTPPAARPQSPARSSAPRPVRTSASTAWCAWKTS